MLTEAIPGTGGLKPGILVGGVASAAARTVVETPFELIKVRLQTGGSGRAGGGASLLSTAQLAELYTGAGPTSLSNAPATVSAAARYTAPLAALRAPEKEERLSRAGPKRQRRALPSAAA